MYRGCSPDVLAPLTDAQLDALRETANIGAGHGAVALSRMLHGERVGFEPPRARELTAAGLAALLGEGSAPRVVAGVEVEGEARCSLWLVLSPADAASLAQALTQREAPGLQESDAALTEAARTVGSAALAAMARLTGLRLNVASSRLWRSSAGALARERCGEDRMLVLDVQLRLSGVALELLVLPEASTLGALLRALRV